LVAQCRGIWNPTHKKKQRKQKKKDMEVSKNEKGTDNES
jgi:hypothetical protein